jgi:hypothetical protein
LLTVTDDEVFEVWLSVVDAVDETLPLNQPSIPAPRVIVTLFVTLVPNELLNDEVLLTSVLEV